MSGAEHASAAGGGWGGVLETPPLVGRGGSALTPLAIALLSSRSAVRRAIRQGPLMCRVCPANWDFVHLDP